MVWPPSFELNEKYPVYKRITEGVIDEGLVIADAEEDKGVFATKNFSMDDWTNSDRI